MICDELSRGGVVKGSEGRRGEGCATGMVMLPYGSRAPKEVVLGEAGLEDLRLL